MISITIRTVHNWHRHMHNRFCKYTRKRSTGKFHPSMKVSPRREDIGSVWMHSQKYFAKFVNRIYKITLFFCCAKKVRLKMSILILSQVSRFISVLVTWQWPLCHSRSPIFVPIEDCKKATSVHLYVAIKSSQNKENRIATIICTHHVQLPSLQ